MKHLFIFIVIFFIALTTSVYGINPVRTFSFGSFGIDSPEVLGVQMDTLVQKNAIRFVGDIMLARDVERKMQQYGDFYPLSRLPALKENSYLVGNFEAAIPVVHTPTKDLHFSFSVDEKYIYSLKNYGFTHLGLANNHSFDFGKNDFIHTVDTLNASSLIPFGDPTQLSSSSISLFSMGSSTVAVVGVYAVDTVPTDSEIQSVLDIATAESDLQFVYIHWGTEYSLVHSSSQNILAHKLIDAGADVIIGHHPHVVQDIEVYKNKVIFYSLGNFIFDQYFSDDVQKGLMLDFSQTPDTLTFSLIPISSLNSRTAPQLMTGYEKDIFMSQLSNNSDTALAEMITDGVITLRR